jgi:glycosyltransferase involved in cell wall biosynthesis
MNPSLIICTYNAPRELEFGLCGVARQSVMPHEVIIADDGSGDETRAIVERWRDRLNCPVKHVWQSDRGYRKARIVNEAVRQSSGDYLLFLDGDSFPHPRWVEDHMASARPDTIQCGRRVKLGPELSPTVCIEDIEAGLLDGLSGPLIRSALKKDTLRLALGIRLPLTITRIIHPRPRRLMGVNYSVPKDVFLAVNGYDEAWTVYGHEDFDIEQRLKRAGYRFQAILNRGIVYHVYHPEREQSEEGMRLVEKVINGTHIRCESGIKGGAVFDPSC